MTVADLVIKLALDGKGVSKGADQVVKEINKIGKEVKGMVAGFVGFEALKRGGEKVIEYASKINDAATKTGASTKALQEFDYAAAQSGASLEDVTSALKKMQVAQVAALGGDEGKQNAFARLGVSLADLKSKNPEELFRQMAVALKSIAPSAQVTADVIETMGKSADVLLPAFREGFSEAADRAKELGLIIDDDIIKKLDDMADTWGTMGRQIMASLAPVLGWMADRLNDIRALIAFVGGALGSLSVDFQKNKFQTITDLMFPTSSNAFGRAVTAGSGEAMKVYDAEAALQAHGRGHASATGELPNAERQKKIDELKAKTAKEIEEAIFKSLNHEQQINFLWAKRAELAKEIAAEKDPLKKEELRNQQAEVFKQISGLKSTAKANLGSPIQADQLARIGLFRGPVNEMKALADKQVAELKTANRTLNLIEKAIISDA
jgi:hypothetical protein